jgi:hypothetical protein
MALKVLSQLDNYLLCYPILPYNLLISSNSCTLHSLDILDIQFLNND